MCVCACVRACVRSCACVPVYASCVCARARVRVGACESAYACACVCVCVGVGASVCAERACAFLLSGGDTGYAWHLRTCATCAVCLLQACVCMCAGVFLTVRARRFVRVCVWFRRWARVRACAYEYACVHGCLSESDMVPSRSAPRTGPAALSETAGSGRSVHFAPLLDPARAPCVARSKPGACLRRLHWGRPSCAT